MSQVESETQSELCSQESEEERLGKHIHLQRYLDTQSLVNSGSMGDISNRFERVKVDHTEGLVRPKVDASLPHRSVTFRTRTDSILCSEALN